MKLRWPWSRTTILTFTLLSGRQLQQECWSYSVKHSDGEQVTATSWTFAGRDLRLRLLRCDQIAAFQTSRGPLRWRGWMAGQ